jgi:hypothetical protein
MNDPEQRAASWWEAAKYYARGLSFYAERYDAQRARANAAEAKLAKIHEILEDGHTGLTTIARIRSVVEAE